MIRSLYDWVIRLAAHPRAIPALGVVSFLESSVFPIPPDVMLIPMVLANRKKAFTIALVCTVCSVLGGMLGYAIGYYFFDTLGEWVVRTYHMENGLAAFRAVFEKWGIWIILIKGLTPIPYKLVTSLGCGPLRPVHVRVGVHRDAWRALLPRGSLAVEVRRADPDLRREAPDAADVAVPDRADRRVRRLPLHLLGRVHDPG